MAEIRYIHNPNGPTLGLTSVKVIEKDGLYFKDLDGTGELKPYEDWRLTPEERAADLATRLSVEQIAGLMLYSAHQAVPNRRSGHFGAASYDGKPYDESGRSAWELSDQQRVFLEDDNVRHVLVTTVESPAVSAKWNNELQAFCEARGLGIPVNISSDPRHGSDFSAEYSMGAGGTISLWPEHLGLAATFDPEVTRQYGYVASKEYRALGIATALSPQTDLATDPRWSRFMGTFGESPELSTDMCRAYCDGFQTSVGDRIVSGHWGYDSVNAMVKHWPSGGSGEGGRDAHYNYGKYAVYPADRLYPNMKPFLEGAFKLNDGTEKAAAVMPYYTISWGADTVGNGYSKFLINDLLREKYGYDGVVCTDWGVTRDEGPKVSGFFGKCWGVELKTVAERHYIALMAGCDQFGGNNDKMPVLEAYEMGVKEHGEEWMRKRFELSARRLLLNFFRCGLFENPYLDVDETVRTVACEEFKKAGFEAQCKSVVMVKNHENALPIAKGKKVYVPMRYRPASKNFFGMMLPEVHDHPIPLDVVSKYYQVVDTPEEADFALCCIAYANGGNGYEDYDVEAGGNGYVPISLQYRPYTAHKAREVSICGGDPLENFTNRSYKGKSITSSNESDLDMVLNARKAMGDKPVITVIRMSKPGVVSEFEADTNAILVHAGISAEAMMEVVSGAFEPSGLLPMQVPADMDTVEEQMEDAPFDMRCHVDTDGNTYDFGFGMNWNGPINDERVRKYVLHK